MKYVALDIETTGLDPQKDQILQIAMVLEDTTAPQVHVEDLPTFERVIRHPRLSGDPAALAMNAGLISAMAEYNFEERRILHLGRKIDVSMNLSSVIYDLNIWFYDHFFDKKPIIAGKNVGSFDLQFMGEDFRKRVHYRSIEVGSVMLGAEPSRWLEDKPPSLNDLLHDKDVAHDALEDARDVIRVLRRSY